MSYLQGDWLEKCNQTLVCVNEVNIKLEFFLKEGLMVGSWAATSFA
jgi:hypothetical protein